MKRRTPSSVDPAESASAIANVVFSMANGAVCRVWCAAAKTSDCDMNYYNYLFAECRACI